MSGQDDDAEKSHAPSERRLAEARRKGDIAQAADLVQAAAIGGLAIALVMAGPALMMAAVQVLAGILQGAGTARLGGGQGAALSLQAVATIGGPLLPIVLVPAACAIGMLVVTRTFVVAADRIRPRLSRLSPLSVATHKFGPDGIVEFLRGTVKFVVLGVIVVLAVGEVLPAIIASSLMPVPASLAFAGTLVVALFAAGFAVTLAGGMLDFLWQHLRLVRRNMMSRKDMMEEARDSEGDPHQRSARRARAREISARNAVAETRAATVVLVNPTHIAIALRWRRGDRSAPVVVAKGEGEAATRMREAAQAAGVPIWRDVPTARAIWRDVRSGQPILRAHFEAVATAIRFAERVRRQKGRAT
jgi:flagellar biosynthetic protein FlhB